MWVYHWKTRKQINQVLCCLCMNPIQVCSYQYLIGFKISGTTSYSLIMVCICCLRGDLWTEELAASLYFMQLYLTYNGN